MRTDGVFTLGNYTIKNWAVDRPLRFIPWGDVHRDSPSHSEECWSRFKESGKSLKDVLFMGMGDYLDSYSTSERCIIYNEALHESTRKREEELSQSRISCLAAELDWMRGKCVGLLQGNHFVRFADGTDGDMRLAERLNTRYLGVCTALRLTFAMEKSKRVTVDIFAHHGKGGGTTAGGKFNSVEKLATVCEADIFLMGDNHARGCFPLGDKLRIGTNGKGAYLRSRHAWIGRTGSFLKAYEPGEASYVVDRALTPSNLGWIEFILTPRRTRADGEDRLSIEIKALQ